MKKRFLLSILLGAFFLWLAFRNVAISEVVEEIKAVEWKYLIPASVSYTHLTLPTN